jgi:hypothetical protein
MNMMQNPNAPQPPWAGQAQQMPPQQPPPMFSQGQGMPGQPPPPSPMGMGGPPGAGPQGMQGMQGQGMDPAMVKAMLALQQQQPEMEEIARQRKLADMLRQGGKAQLQGVQAGRVYRAPTALNAAASIFSDYAAQGADRDAAERSKGLAQDRGAAAQQWFEGLTGKKVPVPPPANPMAGAGADAAAGAAAGGGGWFKGMFGG